MPARQKKITDTYKSTPKQNKEPTIHYSQEAGPSGLCKFSSANQNKKKTIQKPVKKQVKFQFVDPDSSDVDSDDIALVDLRQPNNKSESSTNKLPKCIFEYQFIKTSGYEGNLKISTYCANEFKKLTNLDERIDKHLKFLSSAKNINFERNEIETKFYIKSFYTDTRKKLHYPYNGLKFNSSEAEAKLKTLVSYPLISSDHRYSQYRNFMESNYVKECHVDMSENNLVYDSVRNYFNNKLEDGVKEWHLSLYRDHVDYQILVDYYSSIGREKWYLEQISLEKLCEISNFEEILQEAWKDLKLTDEEYNEKLKRYYHYIRCPEKRIQKPVFQKFKVHPKYELNWNVISMKQEKFLIQSIRHFRYGTNIEAILKDLYKNSRTFRLDAEIEKLYKFYCQEEMERKSGIFNNLVFSKRVFKHGLPPEENQEVSRMEIDLQKTTVASSDVLSQQNNQSETTRLPTEENQEVPRMEIGLQKTTVTSSNVLSQQNNQSETTRLPPEENQEVSRMEIDLQKTTVASSNVLSQQNNQSETTRLPTEENQEVPRMEIDLQKTTVASSNVLSQQNNQSETTQEKQSPAKKPFSLVDHLENQKKYENASPTAARKNNRKLLSLSRPTGPKNKIPENQTITNPTISKQPQKPRVNPNSHKRKLPDFLQNLNKEVEVQEEEEIPAPDLQVESSEPIICNGEIVMESMAAILKRTGTSNIQNPVSDGNGNVILNNQHPTGISQASSISIDLEALISDSPKVTKSNILQKLKNFTNILNVVKVQCQILLNENFAQLWERNKKKYFLLYAEKKIFIEQPDLTAIRFKEGYSEEMLRKELNVYFLVKKLDEGGNEPSRNNEVVPSGLDTVQYGETSNYERADYQFELIPQEPNHIEPITPNSNIVILNQEQICPPNVAKIQPSTSNFYIPVQVSIDPQNPESTTNNPIPQAPVSLHHSSVRNEVVDSSNTSPDNSGIRTDTVPPIKDVNSNNLDTINNESPPIQIKVEVPSSPYSQDVEVIEVQDPIIVLSESESSSTQRLLYELDSSFLIQPANDTFMRKLEQQNQRTEEVFLHPMNSPVLSNNKTIVPPETPNLNDTALIYQVQHTKLIDLRSAKANEVQHLHMNIPQTAPKKKTATSGNKRKAAEFGPLNVKNKKNKKTKNIKYNDDTDDED